MGEGDLTPKEWARLFRRQWVGSTERELVSKSGKRCPYCRALYQRILRVDWVDTFELYCLNRGCGVMVSEVGKEV